MISRIYGAEDRIEALLRQQADLERRMSALEQTVAQQWGGAGGGGTGGGPTVFQIPDGGVVPAGGSATFDVYRLDGGTSMLYASSATIYNPLSSDTVASNPIILGSNGDGTYCVVSQSC